ncbi:MAG: 2-amino-4-hydroxy-6-hydroxymethyldihydropteridine diphosphokinase [Pseudonocardiales bacterium]|nr:MAG: 2-amino-4-hydroxy-6-hydroxymethyldihydropteridine diphosphokinase [Pseudonocardiales bacterium]
MTTAVLSIGSNLGDRLAAMRGAVTAFRPWLIAVSPVYETAPWGPVLQADFLNAVLVAADPGASAGDWLERAQAAERAAGRTREVRWGARTLDVDVVTVDQVTSDDPVLTLPHPHAVERAFVLVPWLAVQPDAHLSGRPVRDLLAALPPDEVANVRARPDLAVA